MALSKLNLKSLTKELSSQKYSHQGLLNEAAVRLQAQKITLDEFVEFYQAIPDGDSLVFPVQLKFDDEKRYKNEFFLKVYMAVLSSKGKFPNNPHWKFIEDNISAALQSMSADMENKLTMALAKLLYTSDSNEPARIYLIDKVKEIELSKKIDQVLVIDTSHCAVSEPKEEAVLQQSAQDPILTTVIANNNKTTSQRSEENLEQPVKVDANSQVPEQASDVGTPANVDTNEYLNKLSSIQNQLEAHMFHCHGGGVNDADKLYSRSALNVKRKVTYAIMKNEMSQNEYQNLMTEIKTELRDKRQQSLWARINFFTNFGLRSKSTAKLYSDIYDFADNESLSMNKK